MKIDPCPFCDESNTLIKKGVSVPFGAKSVLADGYYVECQDDECGAATIHQPTEQDAVNAWNACDVWGYDE